MDLRLTLAILLGKTISFLNKISGSGGTAAPGLYALKIDPNLVKKLSKKIEYGSVIISGTNGKTTTARLAADILGTKYKVIHNRQGSNLMRGIASTLISHTSLIYLTVKLNGNLAIWEIDEATLPNAILNLNPKTVCLINLFRDQLDRYGEIDTLREKWQKALATLPKNTTVILNADDPGICYLEKSIPSTRHPEPAGPQRSRRVSGSKNVTFFGVEDKNLDLPEINHVADIRHCLNCGKALKYTSVLSAHMGHYSCPNCGFERPKPSINTSNLKFNPDFSTNMKLSINYELSTINYNLPGLYNVYNILAATSIAHSLKIDHEVIKKTIESFSAAFGRFQSVRIPASPAGGSSKSALIFLIKNPTGANEVLRTIAIKNNITILAALNDNFADGKDVSWIWDTNWEILKEKVKTIQITGIRAWDLVTRLKYAGYKIDPELINENIEYSINNTASSMDKDSTLIILPTYTALLAIQSILQKQGGQKWHAQ